MIKSTDTHLIIDLERIRDFAEAAIGVILVAVCAVAILVSFWSYTTTKPNPKTSDLESVSKNQEVVLEHTNRRDQSGNNIVVYCDLPSYDRIYVLNGSTMYVEKGGCAGLP